MNSIIKTRIDRLEKLPQGESGLPTYEESKAKREAANAELARIQLGKEQGLIILRADALETFGKLVDDAKRDFLSLAERFPVPGLEDEIYKILTKLSKGLPDNPA
ncbi:MAG: hypothetical protein HQL87_09795 [Magnetococcales bacterium]|nr:hypothetical protein [Magnetococcales bacterium]